MTDDCHADNASGSVSCGSQFLVGAWWWYFGAIAVVAILLVFGWDVPYGAPFLFDDDGAIVRNASIRSLTEPPSVLAPPGAGTTVQNRPVLNLSFALNYAISGLDPRSYRVVNLLIHGANAFLLMLVVTRVLRSPRVTFLGDRDAFTIVVVAVTLWAVHPLTTQAVTYIAQRAESLATMFILVSLLFGLKVVGADSTNAPSESEEVSRDQPSVNQRRVNAQLCWLFGLLGVGVKETAAVIPILLLVLDAAYFSRGFREALIQRRGLYASLMSIWLVALAAGVTGGGRGGTVGSESITPWAYLFAQGEIICSYVSSLVRFQVEVFDYGRDLRPVRPSGRIAFAAVAAYTLFSVAQLFRAPRIGAVLVLPLICLGPSSSIVPIVTQIGSVHRFYLASAVLICLAVTVGASLLRRYSIVGPTIGVLVAGALLWTAVSSARLRHADYAEPRRLWEKTAGCWPLSRAAMDNMVGYAASRGDWNAAFHFLQRYLEAGGDPLSGHVIYVAQLKRAGRYEAAAVYARSLAQRYSTSSRVWNDLALAEADVGRTEAAIRSIEKALKFEPSRGAYHCNYGEILLIAGRRDEAIESFQRGLSLDPDFAYGHLVFGTVLSTTGRLDEAEQELQHAIRLDASLDSGYYELARIRLSRGDVHNAKSLLQTAAYLNPKPEYVSAIRSLGQ